MGPKRGGGRQGLFVFVQIEDDVDVQFAGPIDDRGHLGAVGVAHGRVGVKPTRVIHRQADDVGFPSPLEDIERIEEIAVIAGVLFKAGEISADEADAFIGVFDDDLVALGFEFGRFGPELAGGGQGEDECGVADGARKGPP